MLNVDEGLITGDVDDHRVHYLECAQECSEQRVMHSQLVDDVDPRDPGGARSLQ